MGIAVVQSLWLKYQAVLVQLMIANQNFQTQKIIELTKKKKDLEDKLDTAQAERQDAWADYVNAAAAYQDCQDSAYRDCDGAKDDCQIKHTQNVTSCECNCNYRQLKPF